MRATSVRKAATAVTQQQQQQQRIRHRIQTFMEDPEALPRTCFGLIVGSVLIGTTLDVMTDQDDNGDNLVLSHLSDWGDRIRHSSFLQQISPSSYNSFFVPRTRTDMEAFPLAHHFSRFRNSNNNKSNNNQRASTIQRLNNSKTVDTTLQSKYKVRWTKSLGEGTFGSVYFGRNRVTGEPVAVKKISKQYTNDAALQREMDALLHVRENGGHPNICGLQENYDEGDYYYLVLDLISGGEMFDHLCSHGPYSEADAARLVREVASALAFMHGIGIIHGDLKPENLMLSTAQAANSVIKVVDFGCAVVREPGGLGRSLTTNGSKNKGEKPRGGTANTPAYSPPEILDNPKRKQYIEPSFDMWALGVILYIMLTGVHPFDLHGNSTDEEIEHQILSGKQPPLRKSPLTAHLSEDAIGLIQKLLLWDPKKRMTAEELLQHPWVRGETARTSKMADSNKRLSAYRAIKTKLGAKVFAGMVEMSMSDNLNADDVTKKTSLIERSFQALNPDHRGFVSSRTLRNLTEQQVDAGGELSLSGFSDILAENMKNRYFPKGHVVYHENDKGHSMYFINSGTVEVYAKDGAKSVRKAGNSFGESALLHPKQIRSSSVRCLTPVHAIQIDREYFEKFMATDSGVKVNLREKDKLRRRQRAKTILQLQQNMRQKELSRGDYIFQKGEEGNELYIIEEGRVNITTDGVTVIELTEGAMTGEHSLIFGRPRNVDAVCVSDKCKIQAMRAKDFYKLLETYPSLNESMRDICHRRDFQKAVCARTGKPFPKTDAELRQAFRIIDTSRSGAIELREIRNLIKRFDPQYSEQEIREMMHSLDLDETGKVSWEEFKKMFGKQRF